MYVLWLTCQFICARTKESPESLMQNKTDIPSCNRTLMLMHAVEARERVEGHGGSGNIHGIFIYEYMHETRHAVIN